MELWIEHCYPCFSIYTAIYMDELHVRCTRMHDFHELEINLLKSKFECCPVFQL